jgi:WD40 repeat protein
VATVEPAGPAYSVAFSPDGTLLAHGAGNAVVLSDLRIGRPVRVLTGHTGAVWSVAFSPDGTRLATGGAGGTVRLWDTATGRQLTDLSGHTGTVLSVAFSPDGTRLATGGDDGTVRLWDTATGRQLATMIATRGGWAVLLPDGSYKFDGDPAGAFWWAVGLCRFEPGELDPYIPDIRRIPADAPLPAPIPKTR